MTPKSISSRKYPDFIRTNLLFKLYKEPEKVFTKIGLDNSREEVPETYFDELKRSFAVYVAKDLASMKHTARQWGNLTEALNSRIDKAVELLQSKDGHTVDAVKLSMELSSEAIKELGVGFWSSAPVREAYEKFIANIPKDGWIILTSSGQKAFWDIATMSMRGTKSCQRWGNENHRQKVIGTMIDPNAAIIYIETDGKTKYGSKMIRRSVVRLVVNKETGKKLILIERVYPHSKEGYTDKLTFELFKDFIKRKTKNKFDVVYGEGCAKTKYYIPLTPQVEDVSSLGKKFLSYRDSGVEYLSGGKKKAKKG